jgi:hypothetical protein
MPDTLIITNVDLLADEEMFSNDYGSWNVSRAKRDCLAGKHKCYQLNVDEAMDANRTVTVDEDKIELFMRTPQVFEQPLISIVEDGKLWLIDGHHSLNVFYRLGIKECVMYVIEEADSKPYIIRFNGQRIAPFKLT